MKVHPGILMKTKIKDKLSLPSPALVIQPLRTSVSGRYGSTKGPRGAP
jgi:hypothetical protein